MNLKLLAASLALALAVPALAGPPIMCHPLDIAKAKCLPMGPGAMECSTGLSAAKAIDETLTILKGDASPLVRMETIRRATVYVAKDGAKAKELLSRVMALALDQSSKTDKETAAGLFDAGFLAACYAEMSVDVGWKPGEADGVQGYAWIKSAIAKLPPAAPERAEMEFGAALATHPLEHTKPGIRAAYDDHLKQAEAGCKTDSLLASNIKAHHELWDAYIAKADSKEKKENAKPDEKK
jgi:hypothetical protein